MKKVLFSVALALVFGMNLGMITAQAQSFDVGIKGGLNIPNLKSGGENSPLSEGFSSLLAWGSGIVVEKHVTKTFSIQTGIEYSLQGGKKDGVQAIPAGPVYEEAQVADAEFAMMKIYMPEEYLYADFYSEPRFHYLMLPVQAKFGRNISVTSPLRVYLSGGIFGSYLLKGERITKRSSGLYADAKSTSLRDFATPLVVDMIPFLRDKILAGLDMFGNEINDFNGTDIITDDVYRFNFGVIGSLGVSCKLATRHSIFIEGGGNYGLIKIQKDKANGQNRIGAVTAMLGYSFLL